MSDQLRPVTRGALSKFRDHFNARLEAIEGAPMKAWLWLRLVRAEGRNRRAIARVQGRYDDLLTRVERIGVNGAVERLALTQRIATLYDVAVRDRDYIIELTKRVHELEARLDQPSEHGELFEKMEALRARVADLEERGGRDE